MTRFNFREACLLDASGELGPAARQQFLRHLRENPAACLEYEEIRQQFELLQKLPLPNLSYHDCRSIPADIKVALQHTLQQRKLEKRARLGRKLIRYALSGVASAAAAILIFASLAPSSDNGAREQAQVAKINATIERLAGLNDRNPSSFSSYDEAVTDLEASIRQMQTESPTLAQVHDKNLNNLLDVLATLPLDMDDFAITDAPPGSL